MRVCRDHLLKRAGSRFESEHMNSPMIVQVRVSSICNKSWASGTVDHHPIYKTSLLPQLVLRWSPDGKHHGEARLCLEKANRDTRTMYSWPLAGNTFGDHRVIDAMGMHRETIGERTAVPNRAGSIVLGVD